MVEVEVAGLEDAHNLNAFEGFAVEGDGGGGDDLGQEAVERGITDLKVSGVDQSLEAVEDQLKTV